MKQQKYWKNFEEYNQDPNFLDQAKDEFPELVIKSGVTRRTFLELLGLSAAAALFSSCRAPEQKIIPFVHQPVEMTPGVANWYASTCSGCSASCGVLVKVRDGRPIKLEGNDDHPLNQGGLCPVAHGMVFGLYDSERLKAPQAGGKDVTWEELDNQINQKWADIKKKGGKVRVLTAPIVSPTSQKTIATFLSQFADGKHVLYQPVSFSGIRDAHQRSHNVAAFPAYHFDKARYVVSFDADFLGTWMAPAQFARGYSQARSLEHGKHSMYRHVQFESRMSLTGSNADQRIKVSPAEEFEALLLLAKLVATKAGQSTVPPELTSLTPTGLQPDLQKKVAKIADELWAAKGEALVVSGLNDVDVQYLINFINQTVGSYGTTLTLNAPSAPTLANDQEMVNLINEMKSGQVAALIFSGVNPAYDYYAREEFYAGIEKVGLKISLNPHLDETASVADYICPPHHFLEAWNDAEPVAGVYSLNQPTIAPLFKTRAYQENFLRWSGNNQGFYEVLRTNWKEQLFPKQTKYQTYDEFWDTSLRDGVFLLPSAEPKSPDFVATELKGAVERLHARHNQLAEGLALVLYEKVTLRDGTYANNPWLQELPDPITKVVWDNYACVSPKLAEQMQLEEGTVVRLTKGSNSIELPVYIQPGQHQDCVAVALGYGRLKAGKVGNGIGTNAFPLVSYGNGTFQYLTPGIKLEKTPNRLELASTQTHHTMDGRELIKELTLAEYAAGHQGEHKGHEATDPQLWAPHKYDDLKWGMAVDLNACTGCSACILSCQAENNIPVVGKDEVHRRREMHWLRLDRYYEGNAEDPKVAFQPVMCSQCENASCESVCPVAATVHSSDGLNMQAYNRCVGTRYCANNCALKVRRFNWFEYPHNDPIANLALNPDVTVRTRGVMEKCTFCVQRLEEVKIRARNENRLIAEGEVKTACQQSCPANAITFGNLADLKSRVAQLRKDPRNFILLEELNLRQTVSYLAKVRNSEEA